MNQAWFLFSEEISINFKSNRKKWQSHVKCLQEDLGCRGWFPETSMGKGKPKGSDQLTASGGLQRRAGGVFLPHPPSFGSRSCEARVLG